MLTGVVTGMPQFVWSKHHAYHHLTNGDWEKYRGPLSIITTEDYATLLNQQDGVCAICRSPAPPERALAVDHCHQTGRVRGLLCDRCNTSLGGFGDSPGALVHALAYLVKHLENTP